MAWLSQKIVDLLIEERAKMSKKATKTWSYLFEDATAVLDSTSDGMNSASYQETTYEDNKAELYADQGK